MEWPDELIGTRGYRFLRVFSFFVFSCLKTISIHDRTIEQFDDLPNNHASFDSLPIVKIKKFDEILDQDRNQKRLKFMFPRSLTPDEEVEEVLSTRTLKKSCPLVGTGDLSYPY